MALDVTTESSPVEETKSAESSTAALPIEDRFYSPKRTESAPVKEHSEPEQGETASTSEVENTESSKPKPERSNAEKRIHELLAKQRELESRLQQYQQPARQPEAKAEPVKDDGPPVLETYAGTWEEFNKATAKYWSDFAERKVQEAVKADRAEQTRLARQQEEQRSIEAARSQWFKQIESSEKQHPDFREKVYNEQGQIKLPLNSTLDTFLPNSKHGTEILYHFATNPEDYERINGLDHFECLREAVKLESKLAEPQKTLKEKPKPPSTVSGGGTSPPRKKSAEDVFYGE